MASLVMRDAIYESKKFTLEKMIISMSFFILHGIISLIETNMFIKDIGMGDQVISSTKFFYSMFAGYFSWFLRVMLSLLLLWALLGVIRSGIVGIIKPIQSEDANFTDEFSNTIRGAMSDMVFYTLGMFLIESCVTTFAAYGPYIFLVIIFSFCMIMYQQQPLKYMEEKGKSERVVNCLNTTHHHTMMLFTLVVLSITLYVINKYLQKYSMLNPGFLESSGNAPANA